MHRSKLRMDKPSSMISDISGSLRLTVQLSEKQTLPMQHIKYNTVDNIITLTEEKKWNVFKK